MRTLEEALSLARAEGELGPHNLIDSIITFLVVLTREEENTQNSRLSTTREGLTQLFSADCCFLVVYPVPFYRTYSYVNYINLDFIK